MPHRRHLTNRTTFSSHLHCPLSLPNSPHSTAIRPSLITPVVHDSSAAVVRFVNALDNAP